MLRFFARCWLPLIVLAAVSLAQTHLRSIHGTVRDSAGAVVVGAHVTVAGVNYKSSTETNGAGEFSFDGIPAERIILAVESAGFGRFEKTLSDSETQVDIALNAAAVSEEINVTANRYETELRDTAESLSTLSRQELDLTAAGVIDDNLRQVPGFTLFRRSGSRTANPTSQGVSLRGIGASGASRALVLYNGIPLNDPFGGWVYWGRIPYVDVGAVEVLRGGASSLYGSGALGGVVNILPVNAERNLFSAEGWMGTPTSPDFSAVESWKTGNWTLRTSGETFRTAGYIPVPPSQRGSVDAPVDSYHQDLTATVQRKFSSGDVFTTASFYNEARDNGTQVQTNDTQLWEIAGGTNMLTAVGSIQARGFGDGQSFNQTFSSIALNRNSESLVNAQHVPAQRMGGSLLWARKLGERNSLVGGADSAQVQGFSNEETFAAFRPTSHVSAGGTQLASGAFLQDVVRLHSRLLLTLGGRYDNWDNYDAQSRTVPLVSSVRPNFTAFADESRHAFSPRAALLFNLSSRVTFTASAYKSFRAPTLNELYRSFRLGNTVTLANSNLTAERLKGTEGGVNLFIGRARMHTAFFWMQVSDPIANVTLSLTPTLITNQRQNLGSTRSRGVEADAEWHFRRVDLRAGYQFVDAIVLSFPSNRKLESLQIPQVAPHQFTAQATYRLPANWTITLQARASSSQFEDDLNQSPLDSYFQVDAYASKRLRNGIEAFAAVENLTNSRIVIGRTPVETVGPPIMGRVGLKVHFE